MAEKSLGRVERQRGIRIKNIQPIYIGKFSRSKKIITDTCRFKRKHLFGKGYFLFGFFQKQEPSQWKKKNNA